MAREEVERLIGAPERSKFGSPEYLSMGFALLYDEKGDVKALLAGQSDSPGVISEAFKGTVASIGMNVSRDDVVGHLGAPDSEDSLGDEVVLHYRSEALTLNLFKGRVHHISVTMHCRKGGG